MDSKENKRKFDNQSEENKKKIFEYTIPLTKAIEICSGVLTGRISPEEFTKWAETILMRKFIPLEDKMDILLQLTVLEEYSNIPNPVVKLIEIEVKKFWIMKLYYTNITISEEEEKLCGFDTYNICAPFIEDILEAFSGFDVRKIEKMLEQSLILGTVQTLNSVIENLDVAEINKSTNSFLESIESLSKDKDLIENLAKITMLNNPMSANI